MSNTEVLARQGDLVKMINKLVKDRNKSKKCTN